MVPTAVVQSGSNAEESLRKGLLGFRIVQEDAMDPTREEPEIGLHQGGKGSLVSGQDLGDKMRLAWSIGKAFLGG